MFEDRVDAGKRLASSLVKFQKEDGVLVAIPRGGVILAEIISRELKFPLELVLVRKIGHPYNREYAVCAVSKSGVRCEEKEKSQLNQDWLRKEMEKERREIKGRESLYLRGRNSFDIKGKTVILVDDGVATGLTYLMAVEELRSKNPHKIIAALPVMPAEFEEKLGKVVDEIVCLNIDKDYRGAVGAYYRNFPQVTDEEVVRVMAIESR